MKKYSSAYHGGKGNTKYFLLSPMSCIDIDNEEDFHLIERIMKSKKNNKRKIEYYK